MARRNKDIQITKILLLRGESADLPESLDTAEFAFTTDQGRLFFGMPEGFKRAAENRDTFPYKNIEILTENATELFAKLHGDRLRRAGGQDYYDAVLGANQTEWTPVQIFRGNTPHDYVIPDIGSVTTFIEYSAYFSDGTLLGMGDMTLRHFDDNPAEPLLEETRSTDKTALNDGITVDLRFKVEGHLNAPYLVFQYRNPNTQPVFFRFNVSRPTPTYSERKNGNDNVGRVLSSVRISASARGDAFDDATGPIAATVSITASIFGTGEIIVFEGWYARAQIKLINSTTTMEGGDVQIRPITTGLPFNDISLSGSGSGDLFYEDSVPQRIYDADGQGVTLYWDDPRVMFVTEARLRLQFSGTVGDDMRATFAFQRWDEGSTSLVETLVPKTSEVISPDSTSWSSENPFDVRRLFQDTWYFDISI